MAEADGQRRVYCVMSARSLGYAGPCLASLVRNVAEPIQLTVITDGPEDVRLIEESLREIDAGRASRWSVHGKDEADRRAEDRLAPYPAVRRFREGHPCWRKITDPPLFSGAGEEMIIIDPDVYFPNRFRFEPTPETGILLMWQRPNCLLPEPVVERAYDAGVAMADHTDIGVCQTRSMDWPFLEEVIGKLGGDALPANSMHVESIVWAALAMRQGGGHLDPVAWHCFANTVGSRMRRKLGADGASVLRGLDLSSAKCLHAGGVAKYWLAAAEREGQFAQPATNTAPVPPRPYRRYPRAKFRRKLALRRLAARLGLYRLLAS